MNKRQEQKVGHKSHPTLLFWMCFLVVGMLILMPIIAKPIIIFSYGLMVVIAMMTKRISHRIFYAILAVALPLGDLLWPILKYKLIDISVLVNDNLLNFSFIGKASYPVMMIVVPVMALIFSFIIHKDFDAKSS